jgi:hypothetical protein
VTPGEHYRRAESLLADGDDRLTALVHAVLATATAAHRELTEPPRPPRADPAARPEPTLVRREPRRRRRRWFP